MLDLTYFQIMATNIYNFISPSKNGIQEKKQNMYSTVKISSTFNKYQTA